MYTYMFRALFAITIIVGIFTTGVASAESVSCPSLTRTIKYGSKGPDVTQLQQFLARDTSVYPEAAVTGFFGKATEKAVQRWQAANGVVSAGTAATTGYGSVGAKTRAAIALCKPGSSSTTGTTVTSSTAGIASSTPLQAQTPAVTISTTSITVVINTDPKIESSNGATTTTTYGTGSAPVINTFAVERKVRVTDDSVFLQWGVAKASRCDIQQLVSGNYTTIKDDAGVNGGINLKVNYDPSIFSLRCDGLGDNSTSTPMTIRRDAAVSVINPVPTCEITTDAASYTYGTTGKISWKSIGADKLSWKDPELNTVRMPFGSVQPQGFAIVSMVADSAQTVLLNVEGIGGKGTCSKTFSITNITTP